MSRAKWAAAGLAVAFLGSLGAMALLLARSPQARALLFAVVAALIVVGVVVALLVRWIRSELGDGNRPPRDFERELHEDSPGSEDGRRPPSLSASDDEG